MNINSAFPGKYIKASDLMGLAPIVVIREIDIEEIGQGDRKEKKPVLYFKGKEKGLVLNKTNSKIIAKLYGDETDEWIGKPIQIYEAEVEFQGEQVASIRVRNKVPTAAPEPEPKPAAKAATTVANADDDIPF